MNKQSTPLQPSPYAERLIARHEQLARAQAERKDHKPARKSDPPTASKPAAVASNVAKLVNVRVEILLKLEEFPRQKWGIGAAICTQGRGCERAVLLTLNRGWHPILRKALLGSDRVMVTYFAGLLLGAFVVFNRRLAVVRALEQKIKRAGGCCDQSS